MGSHHHPKENHKEDRGPISEKAEVLSLYGSNSKEHIRRAKDGEHQSVNSKALRSTVRAATYQVLVFEDPHPVVRAASLILPEGSW